MHSLWLQWSKVATYSHLWLLSSRLNSDINGCAMQSCHTQNNCSFCHTFSELEFVTSATNQPVQVIQVFQQYYTLVLRILTLLLSIYYSILITFLLFLLLMTCRPWAWFSRLFHKLLYISHLFSCTLQFSEWRRPLRSKLLTAIYPLATYVITQQRPHSDCQRHQMHHDTQNTTPSVCNTSNTPQPST